MSIFSKQNRAAANGLPVTRRRALTGLAGLAAGGAVASPALAETPVERLERLANELAETLVEWTNGQFMAVVYPANHSELPSHVEFRNCRLPAHQRRDYHLAQFKRAAEEADPAIADWHVTLDESGRNDCSILIAAYRFTGSYDGDGIYEGGASFCPWLSHPLPSSVARPAEGRPSSAFELRTDMDRMVLSEPSFSTFIGKKVAS